MNFIMQTAITDVTLCDSIIALHKNSNMKTNGCIGNEFGERVVDKNIKDSVDCIFDPVTKEFSEYMVQLRAIAREYIDMFPYSGEYGAWG